MKKNRRPISLWRIGLLLAMSLTVAMWVRSHFAYDRFFLRTGDVFWSYNSGDGCAKVILYGGFPDPPSHCYRTTPIPRPEDRNILMTFRGPMFADGNTYTKTRWGDFSFACGETCVALRPDGSVNWDTPPVLMLEWIHAIEWSAMFDSWSVGLPYWSLLTGLILLIAVPRTMRFPGQVARQIRAQRRLARGLCPHCGYDLRATPARCPECGATPTSTSNTSTSTTDAASPPAPITRSNLLAARFAGLLLQIAAGARRVPRR